MWFNILKVLGTKTGFSQLDFDNIVIEDDDNCKERWQKNVEAHKNFGKKDFKYRRKKEKGMPYVDGYVMSKYAADFMTEYREPKRKDGEGSSLVIALIYLYGPDIPEEVYCKALEMRDKNTTDSIDMEGYQISNSFYDSDSYSNQTLIKKDNKAIAVISAYCYFTHDGIAIDQEDGTIYDSKNKLVEKIKGLGI